VFDRRDVQKDREAGIKSLITFLSNKGIDGLFWSSIALTFLTSLLLLHWLSSLQIAILLLPAIILCLLYEPSKKNFSDYLYYFVLDGLMALSAPILILATFAP
jgi:4-hydroxybenzoate polyprenyltransferase